MYEKQGVSDVSSILLASRHVIFHGRNMLGWDARIDSSLSHPRDTIIDGYSKRDEIQTRPKSV